MEIPITVHILTHPSGMEEILPDEMDFEMEERRIEQAEKEARRRTRSADKDVKKKGDEDLKMAARWRENLAERRAQAEALRAQAEARVYKLRRPSYGELLQARGACKSIDPVSGAISVDTDKLAITLLPQVLVGITEEEMAPNVGAVVWERFGRILDPPRDLVFFSRASSGESKTGS